MPYRLIGEIAPISRACKGVAIYRSGGKLGYGHSSLILLEVVPSPLKTPPYPLQSLLTGACFCSQDGKAKKRNPKSVKLNRLRGN